MSVIKPTAKLGEFLDTSAGIKWFLSDLRKKQTHAKLNNRKEKKSLCLTLYKSALGNGGSIWNRNNRHEVVQTI